MNQERFRRNPGWASTGRLTLVSAVGFTTLIFFTAAIIASAQAPGPPDGRVAYLRAVAPGSTRADVDVWLATLPTIDGLYLIEGDLLYTEQQARGYISGEKALNDPSSRPTGPSPNRLSTRELILNQRPDGLPDYYKDLKDRVLTYAIDRQSFGEQRYQTIVDHFLQGSNQWMALCKECGIQFVHQADADAHPDGETNFVVKYDTKLPKGTIALSFFPSDPLKRRVVRVGPAYFTNQTYDLFGVFRHELGHVLGYRHEHIRNSGCALDAGGNQWIAITPYDSHSVMHYPCGGGGSTDFQFSDLDISGHLIVYGPEGVPVKPSLHSGALVTGASGSMGMNGPTPAALGVNFEGGFVAKNIFDVLQSLNKSQVLPVKSYEIQPGDNPDLVYRRLLGAPQGFSESLNKLFSALNPGVTARQFTPGKSIKVPDVKLSQYEFAISYNPDSAVQKARQKQEAKSWNSILRSTKAAGDTVGLNRYTGYRLVIYGDPKDLNGAVKVLTTAFPKSENVLITGPGQGSSNHYSALGFPKSIVQQLQATKNVPDGVEGDLSTIFIRNFVPGACTSSAVDIFLLDGSVEGHPDLRGGLAFNDGTSQLPVEAGRKLTRQRNFTDDDHATHMAGLIAARANGFGIIGMAPCSVLHPYNWEAAYDSQGSRATLLHKMINERLYNDTGGLPNPPIVVAATDWSDSDTKASMAAYITREKNVLWVVAAGDPRLRDSKADATKPGIPIGRDSSPGPMNLGEEENVLVVTACLVCDVESLSALNSNPVLAPWANYSMPGFKTVGLAAPGDPILSTVKGGLYAEAFGTSQATAVVAGIAAAMEAKFPKFYVRAARIKYWLELTALVFGTDDDQKVAAGVVNPDAALRDPQKNYYATTTAGLREAQKVEWCRGGVKLMNKALTDTLQSAYDDQILRLVYSYSASGGTWTLFTRNLRDDTTPIAIKGQSAYLDDAPLVKIDGVVYNSQKLRDLILAQPVTDTAITCTTVTTAGTK